MFKEKVNVSSTSSFLCGWILPVKTLKSEEKPICFPNPISNSIWGVIFILKICLYTDV